MLSKGIDVEDFESFILEWNIEAPVDRWWRSKHGIAFNSASHREVSFIDMYMEFHEDHLYKEINKRAEQKKKDPYVPGSGDFIYVPELPTTISEEDFDNIEI